MHLKTSLILPCYFDRRKLINWLSPLFLPISSQSANSVVGFELNHLLPLKQAYLEIYIERDLECWPRLEVHVLCTGDTWVFVSLCEATYLKDLTVSIICIFNQSSLTNIKSSLDSGKKEYNSCMCVLFHMTNASVKASQTAVLQST